VSVQHFDSLLNIPCQHRILNLAMLATFMNIAILDNLNEAAIAQSSLMQLSAKVEQDIRTTCLK